MIKGKNKIIAILMASMMFASSAGIGVASAAEVSSDAASVTYSSTATDENAVLVDGKTVSLTGITVTKSGDGSGGDDGDFYGTNAAVLAKGGATLTLKDSEVTTNGAYANGVFSYGSGTTVNVSDTTIVTKSNNSGGIMTTGGATMNATDLNVSTAGNSSAPIRSDRGGGTVTVSGGTYTAEGVGSPGIYSTADITATGAEITANSSEAVVIEGGNSVTLNNATVTGNNKVLNGQSQVKTNVMIYQSMSGDASSGASYFTMTGGTLTAKTGCMFYVTNTTTTINLEGVELNPVSGEHLMTIAAGPWGSSGSNGGNATVNASAQTLTGDISVDDDSTLNLKLTEGSAWEGALSGDGDTYVSLAEGCTWTLTGNSTVKSLSCSDGAIDLNGYTLTVNGTEYTSGASEGTEIEQSAGTAGQNDQAQTPPDQNGQSGQNGSNGQNDQNGQPPALPEGENGNAQIPPDQNGQNNQNGQNGQNISADKNMLGTVTVKTLKAGKKKLTVKFKAVKDATKYQVAVKKGNGKWKIYNTKKTSRTIKKLKSKAKYTVKVRALKKVNGKWNAGQWSRAKSVKVK